VVQGLVYTASGAAAPDGTRVTIRSLDAARPFESVAETAAGSYAMTNVPYFTQVAVTVSRSGWTTRRQVMVFRPRDARALTANVLNFGTSNEGGVSEASQAAAPYFISNRPEITRVEPADEDASLPLDQMRFSLTLSEPLGPEARRRLASAFRLVPNNEEALSEDLTLPADVADEPDLLGLRVASATIGGLELPYAYQQNSGFLAGAEQAEFTWDASGTSASFVLKAPVKTGKDEGGEYAFVLVQRGDTPIRDAEGNALGTDLAGEPGATRDGELILNAIAATSLALPAAVLKEDERWARTHDSYTTFRVAKDAEAPRLSRVLARRGYAAGLGDAVDRLELRFSEPMVAFPSLLAPGTLRLDSYVIATAPAEADLPGTEAMRKAAATSVPAGAAATTFREALGKGTVRIPSARAVDGRCRLAFDLRDARTLTLDLPVGSLPFDAEVLAVRVGADEGTAGREVADPAGNAVSAAGAVLTGFIQ
jgi:hypothetical protein